MLGKGGPGLVSEVIGVFGTWGEVCGEFCCSKWSLVEKGVGEFVLLINVSVSFLEGFVMV